MKNKKIIIVVAAIAILVAGFFGIRIFMGKDSKEETLFSTNAFFIKDSNKYALFSVNGKQLTDFIFTDVDDFYDHVAVVENENDEYAIIKDNGKYLVAFGKYSSIYQDGTLFTAYSDNGVSVLNSKGKVIMENSSYDVENPSSQPYLYLMKDKDVKVTDHNGNVIDTLEKEGGLFSDLYTSVELSEDNNYAQLYYGDMYRLYDLKNNKKLYESDEEMYLYVSEDGKTLAINNDDKLKIFQNGKEIINLDKDCGNGVEFEDDVYVCRTSYNRSVLIDKKGNIIAEDVVSYFDSKNYVKKVNTGYEFYSNGKVVSDLEFKDDSVEPGKVDVAYIVDFGTSYGFVGKDVKVMCEDTYYSAKIFDENGVSIVNQRVSGKSNYSLINSKCNKISDDYSNMSAVGYISKKFYEGKKDNVKYLLGADGKVLEQGYVESSGLSEFDAVAIEYENKTVLYSGETGKKLIEIEASDLRFEENYAYKSENGKYTYYSYETGKAFYTQK